MPGTPLKTLHVLTSLIFTTLRGTYYYSHFADEEIETQIDENTCP